MAPLAGPDSLGAALEVGDPFPVLLFPELALLPGPDTPSLAGMLTVYTGGGYCVKPVQVGKEIVSFASKDVL